MHTCKVKVWLTFNVLDLCREIIADTSCNTFDEVVDMTLCAIIVEISVPKQDPQSHTIENMGLDTTTVKTN